MNKENNNSRGTFLKNISLAIVSVFGIGIAGFSFQKLQKFLQNSFKSIPVSEANKLIAEMKFDGVKQIKPKPAPILQQKQELFQTNEI